MKKIGIIGGTGPESTVLYYKQLNTIISEKTNGKSFPKLSIDSLDLFEVLSFIKEEKYDKLISCLNESVKRLIACDVDYIAFSAVTCHIVYDQVAALSPLPIISIPITTAKYLKDNGYKKVGLLGTIFTMNNDYMSLPISKEGIEIVTPNQKEKDIINNIIYSELEYGVIKPESVETLVNIVQRMKLDDGIEAIILGCTELPLVLNDDISPVKCIDTVNIHICKLAEMIMED